MSLSPSTPSRETYTNIVHQAEVDGGWSGQLRIVVGKGLNDQELVFVDSDLLGPRRLVLTPQQTIEVATRLAAAAAEVVPPDTWDLEAFQSTFGYPPPAEHARTLAGLKRHVRELSDRHRAARRDTDR